MKKGILIELDKRFEAIKIRMKRLEEKIQEVKKSTKFEDEEDEN